MTIVTQNRECLFGDIVDGEMILNKQGLIVKTIWNDLPKHYNHIKLDEYVYRTIFMALSLSMMM